LKLRPRFSSPWFILTVVLLSSMAGTINYYKIPPLMPVLMSAFHLSGGEAGFLMSIFAVAGIAFSIPTGLILSRLGYRITGLVGVTWIAAGAGLGALSTSSNGLLSTRLMEGVGLNLMAVVSPAIISTHFSGRKRAAAVGIWNAWYPLGSTITFVAAPLLNSLWGWRSVWWFGFLYAIAVGLLYLISIKPHSRTDGKSDPSGRATNRETPGSRRTLLNRDVWKLAAIFLSFAFVYVGYLTWTPTFLHRVRGVSLMQAAFMMSLFSVLALASSPSSGWVLGRVRSPGTICASVMVVFTTLAVSICFVRVSFVFPMIIVMGVIGSFLPAAAVAGAAQLVHEEKVSALALSMVTTGQNVGILLGPTLFGLAMESAGGWDLAYAAFIPAGLLGVGASLLLGREKERKG
jgi:MFS family permease